MMTHRMHLVVKLVCFCLVVCLVQPLSAWAQANLSETTLWVPGAYEGWKPADAPMIKAVKGASGMYEGYVNITGVGTPGFKFTNAPDWVHTNYGFGGSGNLSTDGQAVALTVPEAGYYELFADLSKGKWMATKTVWSVIGDATPGGWQSDTNMTYDPAKQVWSTTAAMKAAGSFKFRANAAWALDFGLDDTGALQYVDNPHFPYNAKLKNLTVPADGTYTVTLDLHVPGKYTYTVVKN